MPSTTSTAVSRDQALAIAAQQLPKSVLLQSNIKVQLERNNYSGYEWDVSFDGFTTTLDVLVAFGWSASAISLFLNTQDVHVADVVVDAESGAITREFAGFLRTGGPPPPAK